MSNDGSRTEATESTGGTGGFRERVDRWLDSDLVGIPATLYTFAVLAISLAVFRFAGGVAGMIVAVALWIPMVLFAIQGRGKPPGTLEITRPGEGPRHRVLVIANEVVMLPDREADWAAAAGLAERVRIEVGLPVTAVDPPSG